MKKNYLESKRVNRTMDGEKVTVLLYFVTEKQTAEVTAWKVAEQPDAEFLASLSDNMKKAVAILNREPEQRVYSISYKDLLMFGSFSKVDNSESVDH